MLLYCIRAAHFCLVSLLSDIYIFIVTNYCADVTIPHIEMNDAFVSKTHFFRISLYLPRPLCRDLHPQLHLSLLTDLLQSYSVVILRISLDGYARRVKLFCLNLLYFFI